MSQIKFKVISDSMHPLIKIDDELQLVPDLNGLKVLDIVLFKREKNLVVHFVWRNQLNFNSTVITRCLKNPYVDETPVDKSLILGRVSNFRIGFYLKLKLVILNILKGTL